MPAASFYSDPSLQLLAINDFSAGIINYATTGFTPPYFPTTAPLGAASAAVRCINRPGLGLVPFWLRTNPLTVAVPSGTSPSAGLWSAFYNVGMAVLPGVIQGTVNATFMGDQLYQYTDYLVFAYAGTDTNADVYHTLNRYMSNTGAGVPFNNSRALVTNNHCTDNLLYMASFAKTAQNMRANLSIQSCLLLVCPGFGAGGGANYAVFLPNQEAGTPASEVVAASGFINDDVMAIGHGNRAIAMFQNGFQMDNVLYSMATDSVFEMTDPPAFFNNPAITVTGAVNPPVNYTLEDGTGFGAWGSVSTGELVLVRRGQGAVVVSGDPANPNFVTKLPAVAGTGRIMQRMSMCAAGAVYVTETDGIHAWDGGNTAVKISQQIPDNAAIRNELQYGNAVSGSGAVGVRAHHDSLNNLVFFANNWVYDSNQGSWWMCEDPTVANFATFAAGSEVMYGATGVAAPGTSFTVAQFDPTNAARSWTWVSAPLPNPQPGSLMTVEEVEIVASGQPSTTFTITPEVPPGFTATETNNVQAPQIPVPALASNYRAAARLGFTASSICIRVDCSGPGILHELNIGWRPINTSDVGK